ncbi:uncharacterized protein LOC129579549 [Sitodiplosis mosellana]|uniref:uncharacterized protein LOC129579549 n=1 Tax=Sitodiplosis mosellana TaxID=263140 RepID=UPI002443B437|nr:uncharacterized protein LOC129579549 [Sitodiplosis mosellana]
MAHSKLVKSSRKNPLNSSDLNKHRRAYRDLNTLKIIDNTNVLALQVLQKKINQSKKQLKQLNIQIRNVDNKVVRGENKNFIQRLTSLLIEQDHLDEEISSCKTKIGHLKSQIERVDIELEKYSTLDDRFSADKRIEILENRLLHNNQKVGMLKLEGLKMRDIVSDLMFMRRQFQIDRDDVINKLKIKKHDVIELVDHYAIAFASGMRICRDLETCRIKSTKQLKEHLQEMQHLIRAAETNDILRDFMITKATPITLDSDSVPQREIIMKNYGELSKICDGQLSQIEKYAPNVQTDDLEYKRRQTFSLYLFENEVTENIEDIDNNLDSVKAGISAARDKIDGRRERREYLNELNSTLKTGESKIKGQSEEAARLESILDKYLVQVHELFTALACDVDFGFQGGVKVDRFNLDEVLQIIEIRLRSVMYSVYCWQEERGRAVEKELVHGLEMVRPTDIPEICLINPCPECSQVEARANPDIETLIDKEGIIAQLKEAMANRNLVSRMHHIEDCPKPGSKAVLSKDIKN